MCELIGGAELTVTYNGIGFDNIVIEKYFLDRALNRQMRMRQLDVFARVRDVTGVWMKLDNLLKLNGQETKSADGLLAIKMWAEGNRTGQGAQPSHLAPPFACGSKPPLGVAPVRHPI
jgi:hypothetical protein